MVYFSVASLGFLPAGILSHCDREPYAYHKCFLLKQKLRKAQGLCRRALRGWLLAVTSLEPFCWRAEGPQPPVRPRAASLALATVLTWSALWWHGSSPHGGLRVVAGDMGSVALPRGGGLPLCLHWGLGFGRVRGRGT